MGRGANDSRTCRYRGSGTQPRPDVGESGPHYGIDRAPQAAGLMGMISSIAIVVRARLLLGKGLVVFPKPPEDAVLCQADIYGVVRHPVYSAAIVGTAGWALFWRSLPGLLGSIPVAVFFRVKSHHEERYLLRRFPEYGAVPRASPRTYATTAKAALRVRTPMMAHASGFPSISPPWQVSPTTQIAKHRPKQRPRR